MIISLCLHFELLFIYFAMLTWIIDEHKQKKMIIYSPPLATFTNSTSDIKALWALGWTNCQEGKAIEEPKSRWISEMVMALTFEHHQHLESKI